MRPNKYPLVGEIVMVLPTEITDLAVYVEILDYKLGGLIMLRDLSKNRIRSITKIVQIGKKFPAAVINVDEQTENIVLSKKCVSDAESELCEKNFKESKCIADIAELFKRKMETKYNTAIDISDFYKKFIWCISQDSSIILKALRTAAKDFDRVYPNFCNKNDDINDDNWKNCFCEILANKFKDTAIIVEAVLEINYEKEDGVKIIRKGLLQAQSIADEICPFKIKVVKAPYYSIAVKTYHPQTAVEKISDAVAIAKKFFSDINTDIKIIKQPDVIIEQEFKPADSDTDDSNDTDDVKDD